MYLCRVELNFNNAPISFDRQLLTKMILQIVTDHKAPLSNFGFNFINEDRMLQLNQSYLNHETHTDVITFDYSTDDFISGECYICLDRAEENSLKFSQSIENELYRLSIHAVLHCFGHTDSTQAEKKRFRILENNYLKMFHVKP